MRPTPERRASPSRRQPSHQQQRYSPPDQPQHRRHRRNSHHRGAGADGEDEADGPTPICRCRVLYLGSAVPHMTKDGLQGIQEPLKELYPEDGAVGAKGIDSWLSVWSNGFLLENMDENRQKVTRFFPIESLHYCAAVRYVLVPGSSAADKVARFLPLDSPFARNPNLQHPPLFAAILRRTTGIKVLECHVFICKRETAANALVRCAFHAYADSTYAKHLESSQSLYGGMTPIPGGTPLLIPPPQMSSSILRPETPRELQQSVIEMSEDSINSIDRMDDWRMMTSNGNGASQFHTSHNNLSAAASPRENGNGKLNEISVYDGDENHKVWIGKVPQQPPSADSPDGNGGGIYDYGSTMRSFRSSASGISHRQRPRQMMMPSSPPPPPIPEEGSLPKEKKKEKLKKRSKSRDALDGVNSGSMADLLNGGMRRSSSVMGDPYMAGGLPYMNGHPRGLPPMYPPPPGPIMMVPMHGGGKKSGTFSARHKGKAKNMPPFAMVYGQPPGPPFGMPYGPPPPGYYGPPPPPMTMEEPIYMPHNARPLSPIASYQPGHFPHDAYYSQQQYATIDKANRYRKMKPSKNGSKSSKESKSKNHHQSSDSNAEDSEFGQMYKMKNNQRSRSYGSLANMPYGMAAVPMNNAMDAPPGGKKEQELMQLMGDLDLAEDQIERSEVPPGLYPPGQPPNMMMYGGPLPPLPPHAQMIMMPPDPMMSAGAGGALRRKKR